MTSQARIALLVLGWLVSRPSFVAAAPRNDECTSATAIKRLPATRTLVVDDAIASDGDPLSSCGAGDANVWYVYTARADVNLELDATASTYRAAISVYGGECATPTERACSDRSADGGPGHLIVRLRKGETVRIAVTTSSDPGSTLELVARKSDPRYVAPKQVAEIVRSSDASPYGGGQGLLLTAVAESEKSTVFMQDTGGIFADVGGTLTTIAYSGAPTPVGGTFATFHPPGVSATDVYFLAALDGASVTEGLFRWDGSTVQPFLVPGSPGPAGRTLLAFGTHLAVAKGSGAVAFVARTADANAKDTQLILSDGTTTTALATLNQATPCGGALRSFDGPLAIDAAGTHVVFSAGLRAPTGGGLFVADAHGLTAVACEKAATPLGGTYRALGPRPAIDALGEVYFVSQLNGGPAKEVLWRWAGGPLVDVAEDGMPLAGGDTVRQLRSTQQLATDPAGDVFFTADLVKIGRAILRAPHAAVTPSVVAGPNDTCALGGTFDGINDELDVSDAGTLVFDAACAGGRAAFRKPLAGAPVAFATVASATSVGAGFAVGGASISADGALVAGRGFRDTLQRVGCTRTGCGAPSGVLAPGMPIANAPGEAFAGLDENSLGGGDDALAFLAELAGGSHTHAIVRLAKGRLDAVATLDDSLPGGVGTFADFPIDGGFISTTAPIGVGTGVVAFQALVAGHPTASSGIFAATVDGLTTVALEGDPTPRGDAFVEFGAPVARSRSVIFPARTSEGGECIFGIAAPGKPITAIACADDPLPAPVGGTIESFVSLPSGISTNLYVPVSIRGSTRDQCLLRYRRGAPSLVRCQGDVYLDGDAYDTFEPTSVGPLPVSDPKGRNTAFVFRNDLHGDITLLTFRSGTFFPLATTHVTPAPTSGGVITDVIATSIAGKSVVLVAGIQGGTATTALFRFLLP